MSSFRQFRVLILFAVMVFLAPLQGIAAQPSDEETAPESRATQSAKGETDASPAGVGASESTPKSSRSDSDKFLYLPIEEYRELLKLREIHKAGVTRKIPVYNVTFVEVVGKAFEKEARLEATITVKVNVDDAAVLVPIGLNEAIFTKPVKYTFTKSEGYTGEGESSPGEKSREDGYRWWFKGKGDHELKLEFLVPIRNAIPTRRLVLSIPETAVSRLQLTVPEQRLKVTPPQESTLSVSEKMVDGKPGTLIELFGVRTLLDLQWQILPDMKNVPTSLQVETELEAKQTSDSILLTAIQKIRAVQGSFETAVVHLPAGFRLVGIEGDRFGSHDIDTDNPSRVNVRLTEPTVERELIQLKYTLEMNYSPKGGKLSLEGLRVDGARRETGEITIVALEGFRISRPDDENQSVYRTNVRSNGNENRQFKTAYRYLQQPFQLVVELSEIEPRFTSERKMSLSLTEDRVDLKAAFQVNVYRGAVQTLELQWPKNELQNWDIELVESPDLIEQFQMYEETESGSIRISLVSRKTGRFELPLRASRRLNPDDGPLELSLPRLVGASRHPVLLDVTSADNVEVDLSPLEQTSLVEIPAADREQNRRSYRIDPQAGNDTLTANVTVHEQSVQTESIVLLKLNGKILNVTQRIQYDIAYESLSRIQLTVPEELKSPEMIFSAADETILEPSWSGAGTVASFSLEMPTIGEYEIEAKYQIPLSGNLNAEADQSIVLPLIQTMGVDSSSCQIEFQNSNGVENYDGVELTLDPERWKRQRGNDSVVLWKGDGAETEVPLSFTKTVDLQPQDFSVPKSLIRSSVGQDGRVNSQAQFLLKGRVRSVSLVFPSGIVPKRFWWNRESLGVEQIIVSEDSPGDYLLKLSSESVEGESLLTVDYHTLDVELPLKWRKPKRLACPHFRDDVWVEQTVWEVTMTGDQHLFVNPPGFTPEYDWKRGGLFWSRVPRAEYSNLENWISVGTGPALRSDFSSGNRYQFSRFGPTRSLEFFSLGRAMVVLFGAGLALAVGFILKMVKFLRSFLTLLVVAFAVGIVGLWYSEPVLLLLQPALLGLILALAAASVEGFFKHRRRQPILTLSSPSDYMIPTVGSSTEYPVFLGAGSEEPTAVRSSVDVSSDPISSSELGHGT